LTGPKSFRLGNRELAKLFHATEYTYNRAVELAGAPPVWAEDLLCIARAVFVADRGSSRTAADDRWTRHLRLTVLLLEPDRWSPRADTLRQLLSLLTGDRWDLRFEPDPRRLDHGRLRLYPTWTADEVALFSGGLDSAAYTASRALKEGRVLLIAYREPKEAQAQDSVFASVKRFSTADLELICHSQKLQLKLGRGADITSRSRGLLYAATAVRAAAAHGASVVSLPENGQIAVNPPLTAARSSAASTRSVHPQTVHLLNTLIAEVGGDVTVTNPLADLTKGEVCALALRSGLTEDDLWRTISCGRSPRTWKAHEPFHCGRCFPCLVRRSGLLHAAGHDLTSYKYDLVSAKGRMSPDLVALDRWLREPFEERDLLCDYPLPPGTDLSKVMTTLLRGREELGVLRSFLLGR
jgi:7-cyano-7-deazaguanine synthase in queuosine biosynthesis